MSDELTLDHLLARIKDLEQRVAGLTAPTPSQAGLTAPTPSQAASTSIRPGGSLAEYIQSKKQAGDRRLVSEDEYPTKLPDEEWVEEMVRRKTDIIKRVYGSYRKHNTNISASDDMWDGLGKDGLGWDRMHYFYGGRSALRAVATALLSAGNDVPKRILDLPCGFGRVLRFLRAAFPEATIYGADLNRPGVDFCAEQWGSTPLYSQSDLSQVEFPQDFDLVWCGSLATHLPEEACFKLFNRLIDSLAPGGIAGITVCGRGMVYNQENVTAALPSKQFLALKDDLQETGFAYANYDGLTDYGMTYVDMRWVQKVVYARTDCYLLSYAEKDWHGGQDTVWLIKRPISHPYNWAWDN